MTAPVVVLFKDGPVHKKARDGLGFAKVAFPGSDALCDGFDVDGLRVLWSQPPNVEVGFSSSDIGLGQPLLKSWMRWRVLRGCPSLEREFGVGRKTFLVSVTGVGPATMSVACLQHCRVASAREASFFCDVLQCA